MSKYTTEEEVLRHYDPKKYRTPDGYTSDIVCATIVRDSEGDNLTAAKPVLKLMLIKRAAADQEGNPNIEGGKWAIPGGFGSDKETAYETAVRELSEETGVTGIHVEHFAVFDKPGRDRRGWIISNAHYAIVPGDYLEKRKAADDAEECELFTIEEALALDLAFDHADILTTAAAVIKREMMQTTVARHFLPAEFTLAELRDVLMTVLADDPMIYVKSTFWDKAPKLPFIEPATDEEGRIKTTRREGVTKRVRLFRFNDYEPVASIYR
ncbi:Bifunctional NMN adenylyltransferase/Nudix hydrolase [Paenibacillus konkukensis]|uniref:Bifunctional NMN adenylyltransferase/Nudix hydrolase n=1 Tax=Paenibacillus konkukensis TaxID=2020716 RepID=A0ABY4RGM1_9BACL|nr:NUDIX hydrolase [Paenibacillus doosanensis]UQZ81300.1 Bifunctional NMN adenylyltransferase/Nudix hydrolase [Paenibacillus konkukensis]